MAAWSRGRSPTVPSGSGRPSTSVLPCHANGNRYEDGDADTKHAASNPLCLGPWFERHCRDHDYVRITQATRRDPGKRAPTRPSTGVGYPVFTHARLPGVGPSVRLEFRVLGAQVVWAVW